MGIKKFFQNYTSKCMFVFLQNFSSKNIDFFLAFVAKTAQLPKTAPFFFNFSLVTKLLSFEINTIVSLSKRYSLTYCQTIYRTLFCRDMISLPVIDVIRDYFF